MHYQRYKKNWFWNNFIKYLEKKDYELAGKYLVEPNELRDEVEVAKAAHRSYEQSVTSHFANTAQLLHRMQDDYRSIYTHIASGAQELCDADVASQLDDTKLVGSAFDLADHLVDPAQPLDYAPKKNPDEAGQLSEEFGLERAFKPNVG